MPVRPPRPRLPSLNALRAFEAAARLESFTRAADELGVTAGAITQQVRQFEAWLGFPVFRRLPQGVALTEAAREVLPRLSRGFDMLGQAVQALKEAEPTRPLAIAALPCIAQLWLSPRLPALQQAFAGLQISVSAMEEPPDLKREPYDLAIFYRSAGGGAGSAEDEITPVCAPSLAARLAEPADLRRETLLHDAVWRGDWARWLESAAPEAGVDAGRGPAFSLYSLALDAAFAGAGVLMGRISLVDGHLRSGRLVAPFGYSLSTGDALGVAASDRPGRHRETPAVMAWLAGPIAAGPQMQAPQSPSRI